MTFLRGPFFDMNFDHFGGALTPLNIGGASEIFALIPYSWANLGLNSVNNDNNNKAW